MKCIKCNGQTRVVDTRERDTGLKKRRHQCTSCQFRFNTAEIPVASTEANWDIIHWAKDQGLTALGVRPADEQEEDDEA